MWARVGWHRIAFNILMRIHLLWHGLKLFSHLWPSTTCRVKLRWTTPGSIKGHDCDYSHFPLCDALLKGGAVKRPTNKNTKVQSATRSRWFVSNDVKHACACVLSMWMSHNADNAGSVLFNPDHISMHIVYLIIMCYTILWRCKYSVP